MWKVVICSLFFFNLFKCDKSFLNQKVIRKISTESHVLRVEVQISVLCSSQSTEYTYLIDKEFRENLAFIHAELSDKEKLVVKPINDVNGYSAFSINLPNAKQGSILKFHVTTVYTKVFIPKPAEISQSEKQYVEFSANILFLSSYKTELQESTVLTPNDNILSYCNKPTPVKKLDSKIKYGPYENQPEFSHELCKFNYENGSPFLVVTSLTRSIEISHWGFVSIEDKIDILHYGARLRGSFSRLDYQRGIGQQASVESFKTLLPASARNIYYRDEIGNISTSSVKQHLDSVEVELRPRFPLFGHWKTYYILGYTLPAHEILFKKGRNCALKMRFLDFIYNDQVIDEITLRVVLPETADNIKLVTPFPVERLSNEVEKTYLDTSGRTVIVAKKRNLVEDHIQEFTVHYDFDMINMLREPAMIIAAFLLMFALVMVYVRLDFSLSKDASSDLQQRVQALVDEVIHFQNKRLAIYQIYEDALFSYKSNKDATKFKNDFAKVDVDHKAIGKQISALQKILRESWSEGADKLQELQNLDQRYKEFLQESVNLTERVITGKLSKSQYQTTDADVSSKKVGLVEKMEAIVESL